MQQHGHDAAQQERYGDARSRDDERRPGVLPNLLRIEFQPEQKHVQDDAELSEHAQERYRLGGEQRLLGIERDPAQ